MGEGGQRHVQADLPRKRPGIDCIGGWVGLRAGLDGYGKPHPHRDSIPDRPARSESLYRLHYPGLKDITLKPEIRVDIYFQRFQKYLLCTVSWAGGPQ
jgi:hypothetical protein